MSCFYLALGFPFIYAIGPFLHKFNPKIHTGWLASSLW